MPTRAEAESHRPISVAPGVRILTPEGLTVAGVTAFPEGAIQGIIGHQGKFHYQFNRAIIECFELFFLLF